MKNDNGLLDSLVLEEDTKETFSDNDNDDTSTVTSNVDGINVHNVDQSANAILMKYSTSKMTHYKRSRHKKQP